MPTHKLLHARDAAADLEWDVLPAEENSHASGQPLL
jgi:hypothetical protein